MVKLRVRRRRPGNTVSARNSIQPALVALVFAYLSSSTYFAEAVRTRLTWVNGIGYSLEHMQAGAPEISKIFGGKKVHYCHNPTAMSHEDDVFGYLGDLSQAGTQKLGRITEEVNSLTKHLKDAVASVGKRGKVIHIAHSQGAIVTSLAARRLTPIEMSKIEVVAFGGAAALQKTPQTPFSRCVNYYAANDPLLLLVPAAKEALRSGFIADEEFCFLAPREGDPVSDHALLGKTYAQALAWEGKRFQHLYQSALLRITRSILLSIVAILTALDSKIKEVFKAIIRPILLVFLFLHSNLTQPAWSLFKSKVVAPFLLLLVVIADFVLLTVKRCRGDEYLPVETISREGGSHLKLEKPNA